MREARHFKRIWGQINSDMQTEFQANSMTVTQVSQAIGQALQAGFPQWIWLEGEISGFKVWGRPAKGWFFELKDDRSTLSAVVWASDMPNMTQPREGEQVRVLARVAWANRQGRINLNVKQMQPAGLGALLIEIEARRNRLVADGLTAAERKRPLPRYPHRIALVTSPDSAAAADVLRVLRLRWPLAQVRVFPSGVQGDTAPQQLIRALDSMDAEGGMDVCLLVRGGGSLTDLMAFNDEALCRRLVLTHCPVISGIGHETDTALVDWVSDLYASTPSNAAELATPDGQEVNAQLRQLTRQFVLAMRMRLDHQAQRWTQANERLTDPRGLFAKKREQIERTERDLVRQHRWLVQQKRLRCARLHQALIAQDPKLALQKAQGRLANLTARLNQNPMRGQWQSQSHRLDRVIGRLKQAQQTLLQKQSQRIAQVSASLRAMDPNQVLARGYAYIEDEQGRVLTSGAQLTPDQSISLRMQDHETLDVGARITRLQPK